MRRQVLMVAAGLGLGPVVAAQTLNVTVTRWLPSPHLSDYRLGVNRISLGPVVVLPAGHVLTGGAGMTLIGVGADVALKPRSAGPGYLIGGISGGFLDLDRSSGLGLWRASSLGAGAEVLHLGPLGAVAIEGRYQSLSGGAGRGISIGLRLGSSLLGRPSRIPTAADGVRGAAGAVEFAIGAMGTPYQWGGTGQNGFDCSGLIQFAYGRAGLTVPRRSVDQAAAGREVGREVPDLSPGDILVFSANPGGTVSHVGLYVGDGRFIHSASAGVQFGVLSPNDAAGRWWFQRWISTRRIDD